MKITQNMITNDLLRSMNRNQSELAQIQNQVSTGKRIAKPSAGSLQFSSAQQLETQIQRNSQYQQNAENGLFQARFAQQALENTLDQLYDLKTLVTRGANDKVASESDMEILANQVVKIRQELVDYFNTTADGRFVFSGTNTLTRPFETGEDGSVTYTGNSDALVAHVNDNTEVGISVDGFTLQTFPSGDSIFSLLDRMETAFRAADFSALNGEIPAVDEAVEHFAGLAARVGNNINRLEFAVEQFEVGNINLQSEVSRLVDADYAESLSRIQKLQVAYQAALSANASLLQTSLLNFLR